LDLHSLAERVSSRAARCDASGDLPEEEFDDLRAAGPIGLMALVVTNATRFVTDDPGGPEANRWVWRATPIAADTAAQVAFSMPATPGAAVSRHGNLPERLCRDARCGALHPATSDVCADRLGAAATGDDPDEVARW
jgi:hypothetical protein